MPYIPHTEKDMRRLLNATGASSIDGLFSGIPAELLSKDAMHLPPGLSEQELFTLLSGLAKKNTAVTDAVSFLGAGAYNHYIPAAVDALISRSEFYTAYTPYQPEISQGTLQAIFEYQTLVSQLTAMDVANASLYDGASAVAEAVLMAKRVTGNEKVLLSSALHPEYRETVKTYLKGSAEHIKEVLYCTEKGATLPEAAETAADGDIACFVVQHPNFFGSIEDVDALSNIIHKKNGLLIVVINEPVSLGLLKPPGKSGADIAVGENQSFGNPVSFGGPYLGFMATKTQYVRQMPGRLIGQTVDKNGKRAFCLTFATREQHIRREKATSNICTNHGLCALAASIHLASLGASGLRQLAELNLSKAMYLKDSLGSIGIKPAFTSPAFNEFAVNISKDPDAVLKKLFKRGIIGGLPLKRFYSELNTHLLVAATEMNSKDDIDRFVTEIAKAQG